MSVHAYADADIGEAHAEISSAASEIYCAANATLDMMHIRHTSDEMGIYFPRPATLLMDNSAAEIFINNTALKTRLKHIDCRQMWVRTLRDKSIIKPQHVDTKDNLADIFTKILPPKTFVSLRNKFMIQVPL